MSSFLILSAKSNNFVEVLRKNDNLDFTKWKHRCIMFT